MKHKKEIYEKMKRRDFGESMCDETKLKVLNFVERQLRLYSVSQQCELLRFVEVIKDIADMELHHWTNEEVVEYCIKKLQKSELLSQNISQRLIVGSKVCFISHKNITGVIVDRSDIGFNHWMVKWDRTGRIVREYGADLVVC